MRHLVLAAACIASAALPAQAPANDHCASAVTLGAAAVAGTNVAATTGPEPVPSCQTSGKDVWYSWVAPCAGTYTISTCSPATNFATVVAVWDGFAGCPAIVEAGCSDFCVSGGFQGASAIFNAAAGHQYYVSVGGISGASGTFSLSASLGPAMTLAFFSAGPGTIGYVVTEGPGSGLSFVAIALAAGTYPNGWFYGVDIPWPDLMNEIAMGYPFFVTLQSCGGAVVGPFAGLPPGLTLFGVGLGIPPGSTVPVFHTAAVSGVVP
jgi:hypothetical protein